ncbi:ABC transporter permease [Trinickia symbiotica]|uniref:ABC transporter permease n=1 Tax=Trinickia symbiotica TaxID=863227 RepID=A0A2T3XY64_9BURK|nr:efflux transporter outer membrane subunit [Trinickia symbiotica]PTB21432.1 ABC transporter permease [Trinickia symbiotica]
MKAIARRALQHLHGWTALVPVALIVCACTVGPDFHAPPPPTTQRYSHEETPSATVGASGAVGASQTFAPAAHAPRQWWKQFESDDLDRLVELAFRQSPTLDSARAKLVEARENYAAEAGATEWPKIDANLSATREKIDIAAFGITSFPPPSPFTLYNASVSVSYMLDLFGANRRALEALRAQVDYEAYELEAARLTLAGNIVAAAIRRASLQRQIELTEALAADEAQQLSVIESRYAAGGVPIVDVHSQRTLLAQTRATLPPLTTQLAQVDHQLAILLGVPPSDADGAAVTLDSLHLPETVPITLPSTLARERPDIRAALALLHEASANVGVATANLYPKFSISAGAGSERTRIADELDSLNIWNLGLNVTQPIFHGGELRARKRSSEAAYEAALGDYRQTVLLALGQVADALQAVQDDARTLHAREAAAREAEAANAITREQYAAGGVSRSALLDAQRQALQTALDRARAEGDRLADTAALFQALGGGWTTEP